MPQSVCVPREPRHAQIGAHRCQAVHLSGVQQTLLVHRQSLKTPAYSIRCVRCGPKCGIDKMCAKSQRQAAQSKQSIEWLRAAGTTGAATIHVRGGCGHEH